MTDASDPTVELTIQRLAADLDLPEPGAAWHNPSSVWPRLVGQIAAIGGSRSWAGLEPLPPDLELSRIRTLGSAAEGAVHRVLCDVGVRYCSAARTSSTKARAIALNARSPYVADERGNVVLLQRLRKEVGEPTPAGYWSRDAAVVSRRVLIRELQFFGPKSASDFLLGLGLADCFFAFDVRVLNLLVDCLGWNPRIRRQVATLAGYEQVEVDVISALCHATGLSPLAVDRVLFYQYAYLRRLWTVNR